MLAAIYRRGGGSDALEITEVPTPEPGPGEVRVRITCSGVNPTDPKSLRVADPPTWGFAVPHQDGAGVIDAVGPGVPETRVGQRVWVWMAARERQWGTAAQFSVVPTERAVALPDTASFELGASLGVPALTAWHSLTPPIEGRDVLVAGGAGAVGNMAIQLARWAGAGRIIATVSGPEKAALARRAGADVTVDYRDPTAAAQIREVAPDGVDRVVEVDLAANLELDLAVAGRHAVICSYAATDATAATVPVRRLMTDNLVLAFMLLYTLRPDEHARAVDAVGRALAAGQLTPLPLLRFELAEAGAAQAAVMTMAQAAKVIVDVPAPV